MSTAGKISHGNQVKISRYPNLNGIERQLRSWNWRMLKCYVCTVRDSEILPDQPDCQILCVPSQMEMLTDFTMLSSLYLEYVPI